MANLTRLFPELVDGESWNSFAWVPDMYDEESTFSQAWFFTFDEWGHPTGIPCIICGKESQTPCSVSAGGGQILFGACNDEHARLHAGDALKRAERTREALLEFAATEPEVVTGALRIREPETPDDAILWAEHLLARTLPRLVVLDVETTGLNKGVDEIIEIGVVDETGQTLLDSRIKPTQPIPAVASRVNHITDADVVDAPTLEAVWPQIEQVLSGRTVLCYNVTFDIDTMLVANAARHGLTWFPAATGCVMRAYSAFRGIRMPDGNYRTRRHRLEDACSHFGITAGGHNALGDAGATLRLLKAMAKTEIGSMNSWTPSRYSRPSKPQRKPQANIPANTGAPDNVTSDPTELLAQAQRKWPHILEQCKEQDRLAEAVIRRFARVVAIEPEVPMNLVIEVDYPWQLEKLSAPAKLGAVQRAVQRVLGTRFEVRLVLKM